MATATLGATRAGEAKLTRGAAIMAIAGIALAALAWFGVRRGELWAWVTAVVVPVFALAVALPAHYSYNLDTAGHLGLVYADTVLFTVGAVLALAGLQARRDPEGSAA